MYRAEEGSQGRIGYGGGASARNNENRHARDLNDCRQAAAATAARISAKQNFRPGVNIGVLTRLAHMQWRIS